MQYFGEIKIVEISYGGTTFIYMCKLNKLSYNVQNNIWS